MRAEIAHKQAQTYLRQRNRFAVLAGVLGLTTLVSLGAAVTRDEQVVLVPITAERITVSSGGIDAPYLELVTRDTALMLLNRVSVVRTFGTTCGVGLRSVGLVWD